MVDPSMVDIRGTHDGEIIENKLKNTYETYLANRLKTGSKIAKMLTDVFVVQQIW